MTKNTSRDVLLETDSNTDLDALLTMYKDYTFLMHIACKKTSSFYNLVKIVLGGLNLVLSASVATMDATFMNTSNDVSKLESKTLNNMILMTKSGMVINFTLCIIMGLNYLLKLSEKELYFQINSENYLRLNNTIISELSLNRDVNKEFFKFILEEFNFLIENSIYEIPAFIKRRIKIKFNTYNIPPHIDVYMSRYNNNMRGTSLYKKNNKKTVSISTQSSPKKEINKHKSPVLMKSYSIDSYKTYLSGQTFNVSECDITDIRNKNNTIEENGWDSNGFYINTPHILSNIVVHTNDIEPISPILNTK